MRPKSIAVAAALSLAVAGCSGMSKEEQRVISGAAIGAAAGVAAGALSGGLAIGAGAAIGTAAGAAAGYIYDKIAN